MKWIVTLTTHSKGKIQHAFYANTESEAKHEARMWKYRNGLMGTMKLKEAKS